MINILASLAGSLPENQLVCNLATILTPKTNSSYGYLAISDAKPSRLGTPNTPTEKTFTKWISPIGRKYLHRLRPFHIFKCTDTTFIY